ncbi:MAG TPA: glycosyltransferase [Candidatus Dojkabacteria bacterium]|nr:glycosyltransferase [Candidatus Dojkabacteria bacterium]
MKTSIKYPIISIVTPSYNQGIYLKETIKSVLNQSGDFYLDYIVVDALSSDNSLEIIQDFHTKITHGKLVKTVRGVNFYLPKEFSKCKGISFRYIHEKDKGHYDGLNKGFKLAIGSILAWLNSDDMYHPNALQSVCEVFNQYPKVKWLTGRSTYFDKQGKFTGENRIYKNIYDYLIGEYEWIQQESTFWRRSLWEKAGSKLNSKYRLMVDGELWTRFFFITELYHVDTRLGGYRSHDSNRASKYMDNVREEMQKAIRSMALKVNKNVIKKAKVIKQREYDKDYFEAIKDIDYKIIYNKPSGKINKWVLSNLNFFLYYQVPIGQKMEIDLTLTKQRKNKQFKDAKKIALRRSKIKISVITPSFNTGSHIQRAIESVLQQDYPNWEHIIMDGGSTDGTIEILKSYKHLNWVCEKDNGQADAMNKGFAKSKGNVIVYLNADDYFLPGAFSAVIPEFEKGAQFVVGDVFVKSPRLKAEFLNTPRTTLEGMLRHWEPNAFSHNPVGYFYTRKVQQSVPFNIDNYETMDVEFLLDAAAKFQFTKINYTLGCFEDGIKTKTGVTQSKLDYWNPSKFPYLQKHIDRLPLQKRLQYLKDQREGYVSMQTHMNNLYASDFEMMAPEKLPMISIIMPNLNSAQYITRAVDSLLAQGLKNYEIIVIDDGSTDNSLAVLKNNYSGNRKVKIISNKKNLKPGACRNMGLKKAKGEYIFFMDSDDWLSEGCLIHLASIAQQYKADIVACGINSVNEEGITTPYHAFDFACDGGIAALNHYAEYRIGSVIWNKLYSHDFIKKNNLKFISPYLNDDVVFTTEAIYNANKYISISNRYCNYFQRTNSIINTVPTILHLRGYIKIYKELLKFIEKNGIDKGEEGKDLTMRLLRAHGSNSDFSKLVRYISTRSQEQWESECLEACLEELGQTGYAVADILIYFMKQYAPITLDPDQAIQTTNLKGELEKIYSSRGWKLLTFQKRIVNGLVPKNSLRRKVIRPFLQFGKRLYRLFVK